MAISEKGFGEDSLAGALAVLFLMVASGIVLRWNSHNSLFAGLGIFFFSPSYITSLRSLLVAYEYTPPPPPLFSFRGGCGMLYFLVTGTKVMCQIV